MSKSREDGRRKPLKWKERIYRLSRIVSRSISNVSIPLRTSKTKTRKKIEEIEEKPKITTRMEPVENTNRSFDPVETGFYFSSKEKKIPTHMKPTEITLVKKQNENNILGTGFDFGNDVMTRSLSSNKRKTRKREKRARSI